MPFPQEQTYTVEDFYNMPEDIHAELINGNIVYMAPPSTQHQRILTRLCTAIDNYINENGGKCEVFPAPFGVQLREEDDTIVEPDISVICDPDHLNERGCLGAPDWIIEIVSPSSIKHDYITKLNLYNNAGVREYWIVNPEQQNICVYDMRDNQFIINQYTFHDHVKVNIYDDLYIDFASLHL